MDIVSYLVPSNSGGGTPQNQLNTVARVDYNLSSKTTMFVRYALDDINAFLGTNNNSPYAGFDTLSKNYDQNLIYSLTHTFSPTVVSETKLNFNRLNDSQPLGSQPVQPTYFFNENFAATEQGQTICLPGYSCTTPGNSIPFGGPQNVSSIQESVSWNKGKHSLAFGGEYVYTRDNRAFGAYENAVEALAPFGSSTNADSLNNLLNGDAGWFQVVINPQGLFPCLKNPQGSYGTNPTGLNGANCTLTLPTDQPNFSRSNRYNDMSFYGQDSWKISPRLTLNLGLRWEYYGVQHNKDPKLDSNFVFGAGSDLQDKIRNGQVYTVGATANSPASPVGGLWRKNKKNFAPRIGFAWDVFGDGKTSLRGGYGIAYERNFGNVTFNVIQNPPAQFNAFFQDAAIPLATNNLGPFGGTGTIALPNPSLRYVRQDIPTAYSQSWNLSIQRELRANTLLSLEYTGAHSVKDYSIENLNQQGWGVDYEGADIAAGDNPKQRLNYQYGNMNTRGADGFSYYDALNTRFVSNNLFHQGLAFTANYTWSHTLDNLSSTFSETPQTENLGLLDPFLPALDKGNADFDARNRIALSMVWTLPYAKDMHGVAKQLLDGWEFAPIFTARTGNPYTVFDSSAADAGQVVDTVFGRYVPPAGFAPPRKGTTATNASTNIAPNTYQYMGLQPSNTYLNPLLLNFGIFDGSLASCDTTTNGLGNPVSTGQNCNFGTSMTARNAFVQPGYYNFDFALSKAFSITERVKLQFRSEFYNALNHSNYYVQAGGEQDAGNYPCTSNPSLAAAFGSSNGVACFTQQANGNAGFSVLGKQGVTTNTALNERRFIQMALRLTF
jgi:hypothetical protein